MHQCENTDKMKVQGLLDWAKQLIAQQGDLQYQAPSFEARLLFCFATDKSLTWLMTRATEPLTKHISVVQVSHYVDLVNERLQGTPIAFILGTQEFWSLNLKVSAHTLIPRQDTETLVEAALALTLPAHADVLDLGTGTGAIALALKKERQHWRIMGVDKINEAVSLAKENADLNSLDVSFLQSDWFTAFDANTKSDTEKGTEYFDLIVTNPPYVEENSEHVKQGDLRFEPLTALVSGIDGLDDIRHIIAHAPRYLKRSGYLLIEHGSQQSAGVQSLLQDAGFSHVRSVSDINNIERVTLGQFTIN